MILHVVFTADGIPGWIGDLPREGSEPVEGLDISFLALHQRTNTGKWVPRKSVPAPEPTLEQVAADAEAQYQSAVEARSDAVRQALVVQADPLFFKWQRGEGSKDDWLAKVAEVKALYPKP